MYTHTSLHMECFTKSFFFFFGLFWIYSCRRTREFCWGSSEQTFLCPSWWSSSQNIWYSQLLSGFQTRTLIIIFFNSLLLYLTCVAGNPRLRLRYHEQRLHPDASWPPTFGNPAFFLFPPDQSVNEPWLHPVTFFSFLFWWWYERLSLWAHKRHKCVVSEAERIVSNPHLFLWCMHAGIKATHRAGWPDISPEVT